ncbi:hypothetical protein XELAEV_18035645mg [Xenopus laevis]|uniref:Helix-turn-helix domain-containing protein n=1 Tax=Xenopus laevis TaxID=8355 RepID=A0A974HCN1_XENLA|nr:hypothetical protein XELAEV_18035645mg [Xenopus laevis]
MTDLEHMRKEIIGEIKYTSYDYCMARDCLEFTRWWKIRLMAEVRQDKMKAKAQLKSLYRQLEEINQAIFRQFIDTYTEAFYINVDIKTIGGSKSLIYGSRKFLPVILFWSYRSHANGSFLDLTISIDNNKFVTSLYRKPTDCNGFILNSSCHHRKWLENIPLSQFNRVKRNCSKTSDYEKECNILYNQFKEKGYKKEIVVNAKKICDMKDRNEMLKQNYKKQKTTQDNSISFITTFNNSNKNLEQIIKKHWHI